MLVLDDAEPFDAIRRDFARERFALGIPFHVTLLYPFAPAHELTPALREDVRAFFAARKPFDFELTRIACWPDLVYAVPEPDGELRACMQALFATFSRWPPYGAVHAEVHPHATLGEEIDAAAVHGEIERRAAPHLPHRCQARDVTLLEEFAPDEWRERERFALGG